LLSRHWSLKERGELIDRFNHIGGERKDVGIDNDHDDGTLKKETKGRKRWFR